MENQYKKILVPTGFSDQSLLALDQALIFAKGLKTEIVLLSVLEDQGFFGRLFNKDDSAREDMSAQVAAKLEEIAKKKSKESGVPISTMTATGVVYEEIARVAETIDAEMVVMGTNGRPSNVNRRVIGSNAYRTVTNVKQPVVTIKGMMETKLLKTFIFPLVLDKKSKEKAAPAIHYARAFGAEIKVVSAASSAEEEKALKPHIKQVVKFFSDKGVKTTAEIIKIESMRLHESILDYAYKNNGDIVMIMEDADEGGIRLFGSDTERFVYYSDIPVMCITPSLGRFQNVFSNW